MKEHKHKKKDHHIIIPLAVAVVLVWVGVVGQGVYAYEYEDKIFSGVVIGDRDFSGMTREEAFVVINDFRQELLQQGFSFIFMDMDGLERAVVVYPFVYIDDENGDQKAKYFVNVDVNATINELFKIGRRGTFVKRWHERVKAKTEGVAIGAVVDYDMENFVRVVQANMRSDEHPAKDAGVVYENGIFKINKESKGVAYPVEDKVRLAAHRTASLRLEPIRMVGLLDEPNITEDELKGFVPWLPKVVGLGEMEIKFENNGEDVEKWDLEPMVIASALGVEKNKNDSLEIFVDDSVLSAWFAETIAPDVEVLPQNAEFVWKTGSKKVEKFIPSHDGIKIDMDLVIKSIDDAVQSRYQSVLAALDDKQIKHKKEEIQLVVNRVEPEIKTEETNNLGIKEKMGVGVSDYSGSPYNRRSNIKNAVQKLDGLLIAPDEEFSLLTALGPFNYANGYLEELVIKGDEIKPEIAGGLCQIGTTSFRMAMNSGMPVTERRNHSLVVSYYNDPTNGNPGTDATIYDPQPDFKFLNDTGEYLLMAALMDTATGNLEFTLWGASDGRKGYYSAPVVHRWIGTDPEEEIETEELEPGERKCQSRHPGAEASFTYTREFPDKEKEETVYSSYYRPLPKICLVGVEPEPEEEKKELPEGIPSFWVE